MTEIANFITFVNLFRRVLADVENIQRNQLFHFDYVCKKCIEQLFIFPYTKRITG